jgi:hypothetical protein
MRNILNKIVSSAILTVATGDATAQGTFENLDFEAANIPAGTSAGTTISASEGVPGWSASPYVVYDGASLGGAFVSIIDSKSPYGVLQGNYSVILFGGSQPPPGTATLSQTGLVPANAQSIQMDVAYPFGTQFAGSFTVALGSQTISMSPLQTLANYTIYGGNVAAYAGDVETLTITQYDVAPPTVPPSAMELDNIIFSNQPIPEPQTWTLLLCGAGALSLWRWKRKALTS